MIEKKKYEDLEYRIEQLEKEIGEIRNNIRNWNDYYDAYIEWVEMETERHFAIAQRQTEEYLNSKEWKKDKKKLDRLMKKYEQW